MAYGLELYDSNGQVIVGEFDRLYRLYGIYTFTFPANPSTFQTLTIQCPPMLQNGKWKGYPGARNHDIQIFNSYFVVKLMGLFFNAQFQVDPASYTGSAYIFQI